ncbi:hypothetical protein L2E82_50005 [Cichorium intybus]|nr:hypothetical protein L2E82_50005 [Cichorium intybus]
MQALRLLTSDVGRASFISMFTVHGAWLPPWLATHLVGFQSYAENHCKEHGKLAFESFLLRLNITARIGEKAQAEKWLNLMWRQSKL